jgi:hypothetical protein
MKKDYSYKTQKSKDIFEEVPREKRIISYLYDKKLSILEGENQQLKD